MGGVLPTTSLVMMAALVAFAVTSSFARDMTSMASGFREELDQVGHAADDCRRRFRWKWFCLMGPYLVTNNS